MQKSTLNLSKLQALIKNGISSIPKDQQCQQAIIVIGDTGVGKSTIMNYLYGNKLLVKSQGLKPKLIVQGQSEIKIGHEKYSQTSIPTRVIIEQLAFYDCPGFRDNKGEEYQISNSFFVQKLLDLYTKVKIVLMIDQSHITESRADKLPRLTKNLLRSFKSFEDIQDGVIMIINRADRDLKANDYGREIKKMVALKNQNGYLFGEQEQLFMKFLVDNDRIKLFKAPTKKDKGKQFVPSQCQLSIMPSIKNSDFVKSHHITNIVSESAKIAIRDFIDDVTLQSNTKIERISEQLCQKITENVNKASKNIPELLSIKQYVINLAEEVKRQSGQNTLNILKRQLPVSANTSSFEQDFSSILFFKSIYDKTDTYFSNLINKTYSQLSNVLNKLDTKIVRLQKQEQEELQRRQLLLRRKQIQNQREREKLETLKQIKGINLLRGEINQMGKSNTEMLRSLGDTLGALKVLEQEFGGLRSDTRKLKAVNQQLNQQFQMFTDHHKRKIAVV